MYFARELRVPSFCDEIPADARGHATDLNPGLTVSQQSCKANVQCGAKGLPACRTPSGHTLTAAGETHAFSCTIDGVTMYYPADRTC